jgi:CheY-like chemotaxis protein
VLPAADPQLTVVLDEGAEAASPSIPSGNARLLLVEDNVGLARPTAELLQNAGYEVVVASSGDEAVVQLESGEYDAVLSDIRMPGAYDGIALARWVKQNRAGLPLVLMTGYTSELAQADALEVPVLAKPVAASTVLRTLDQAMSQRKSGA